jgi:hypothetical protein
MSCTSWRCSASCSVAHDTRAPVHQNVRVFLLQTIRVHVRMGDTKRMKRMNRAARTGHEPKDGPSTQGPWGGGRNLNSDIPRYARAPWPPPPPVLPCPALPLAKARDCKGEDIVGGLLLYWLYWLECCSEAQGNKDDQYEGVVRVTEAAVALPARVCAKRVRA